MIITILIAIFVIVYVRKNISQAKIAEAEVKSKQIIIDAERDAEAKKKEAILEAKEEVHKIRNDFEKESRDRKSTRLNSSHANISYAVFCLKKKNLLLSI